VRTLVVAAGGVALEGEDRHMGGVAWTCPETLCWENLVSIYAFLAGEDAGGCTISSMCASRDPGEYIWISDFLRRG
jgi:hypothetical protein